MRLADVVRALVAIALLACGNTQAAEPKYGKVDTFEPGKKYTCVPTADHKGWDCTEAAPGKPGEKRGSSAPSAETTPVAPPAAAPGPAPIPATPAPAAQSRPSGGTLPSYLRASGSPAPAPAVESAPPPAPAAAAPAPEQVAPAASAAEPAAAPKVAEPAAPPTPRTETVQPAAKIPEALPAPSRPAGTPEPTRAQRVLAAAPAASASPTEPATTTAEPAAPTPAPATPEPTAPAPAPAAPTPEPIAPSTSPTSAVAPEPAPAHTQPAPSGARGNREFLALPASEYVIELAHGTSAADLAALRASLQLSRGELYQLHLRRDNGDWWLLVWASFASVDAARAARNELPSDAAINAGWPRRIGALQAEARRVSSNQD